MSAVVASMKGRPLLVLLVLAALLALIPVIDDSRYVLGIFILSAIFAVFASSWDFMSGQTGRENFGHALFIGAGAYTAALLNLHLGVGPAIGIVAGGLVAVCFGVLIGLPTLRLTGPYFAVATLVAATILERLTLVFWESTGGEEGLTGLSPIATDRVVRYYVVIAFMASTVCALTLLASSSWGLLLRAIRGDETACAAAGINTTLHKIGALLVSAFVAGMAGGVYAHFQQSVAPDVFGVILTVTVITMAYVGGIGSTVGAVGAAFLLTGLTEALREFGQFRLLIYTLFLIIVVWFFPGGLLVPAWRRLTGRVS